MADRTKRRGEVLLHTGLTGTLGLGLVVAALATGCGGRAPNTTNSATDVSQAVLHAALPCNDSLKSVFRPDFNTKVTLVHLFKKGDSLALSGTPASPTPPVAANDTCLVKLNVGPGNPGPASAPSTSPGIGIEVWLPMTTWNGRVRSVMDGGWAGSPLVSSLTELRSDVGVWAASKGYASSITDGGHSSKTGESTGSFTLNPDGSINTTLLTDLSTRALHEMAAKTKALAKLFYAKDAAHSYFAGCSSSGRAGYSLAQNNPADFDGILVEDPSINQTQFFVALVWPSFVTQHDLKGVQLTVDQANLVSLAALNQCSTALNGSYDGFYSNLSDLVGCKYDASTDPLVLCISAGGANPTAACLTKTQALAVNKIWYGPTVTGAPAPAPSVDNGYNLVRTPDHLWWGIPRGDNLAATAVASTGLLSIFTDQIALSLQDPTLGSGPPAQFTNATGNGTDGWKTLSYSEYATSFVLGMLLGPAFGNIDTNSSDLRAFRDGGGKMITIQGLNDTLVEPASTANYYNSSSSVVGGFERAQDFHRLFFAPARGHCDSPALGLPPGATPNPPDLDQNAPNSGDIVRTEVFDALVTWVEKGKAPSQFTATSADKKITRPVCMYPDQLTYLGGDTNHASSYACK
jgi:hypothetical protein